MAEKTEPQQPGKQEPQLSTGQQISYSSSLQGQQQVVPHASKTPSTDRQIKIVALPDEQPNHRQKFRDLNLYKILQPYAKNLKIIVQMAIGVFIAIVIVVELWFYALDPIPIQLLAAQTLGIVGLGLIISTAFELAYTLFTDGPDEAVEPLITGLAAVILTVRSFFGRFLRIVTQVVSLEVKKTNKCPLFAHTFERIAPKDGCFESLNSGQVPLR